MTTQVENKRLIETRALTMDEGRSERPDQIDPKWLKVKVVGEPIQIKIPTLEKLPKETTGNPVFE